MGIYNYFILVVFWVCYTGLILEFCTKAIIVLIYFVIFFYYAIKVDISFNIIYLNGNWNVPLFIIIS